MLQEFESPMGCENNIRSIIFNLNIVEYIAFNFVMKHLHHIIPKHSGGVDDPSNLIELTIEEHARAHYILWNQYGRWQDKLAWKSLSKMIGKEEIIFTAQSEGSKELWKDQKHREKISNFTKSQWEDHSYRTHHIEKMKQLWQTPEWKEKATDRNRYFQPMAVEASLSDESRQKKKETFKKIGHQQGVKNSMYGTMWITNGSHSYRIKKDSPIPEGYKKGRC